LAKYNIIGLRLRPPRGSVLRRQHTRRPLNKPHDPARIVDDEFTARPSEIKPPVAGLEESVGLGRRHGPSAPYAVPLGARALLAANVDQQWTPGKPNSWHFGILFNQPGIVNPGIPASWATQRWFGRACREGTSEIGARRPSAYRHAPGLPESRSSRRHWRAGRFPSPECGRPEAHLVFLFGGLGLGRRVHPEFHPDMGSQFWLAGAWSGLPGLSISPSAAVGSVAK
jgi:hypothetical protein